MNAYRASIAVAVLGAFATGIALGTFLNGNSVSSSETSSSAHAGSNSPAGGLPGSSDYRAYSNIGPIVDSPGVSQGGSDVVLRLWSALTHPDDNTRHMEWLSLMRSLTAADAREVREHFRKMKAQGRHFAFEWDVFWQRWGELDGAAAIEQIRLNEPDNAPELSEMVLRGWAKRDPAAARAWLVENASSPMRELAVRGYVDGLARHDLTRATHDALALGGRDFPNIAGPLVEQALLQGNVNGMLDWWRALPADGAGVAARRAAIEPILSRLQEISQQRAQEWLTELAGTPYRDDEQLGNFAGHLAGKDPASAVSWVISLPPTSEGRYPGIGRTTKAWAAKDKAGFDSWVASLPQSPLRDQVVSAQQPSTATAAQFLLESSAIDLKITDMLQVYQKGRTDQGGSIKTGVRLWVPPPAPNK